MRILVVNDDGIYSPGIAALARVAAGFGEVRIVAPDVEQSSMGHAITSARPLRSRPTKCSRASTPSASTARPPTASHSAASSGRTSTSCSPASTSARTSATRSGTPARSPPRSRRRCSGIRGIALSAPVHDDEPDFGSLEPWIERVLRLLLDDELPAARQRQLPARAARHPLDRPGRRPVRRPRRAGHGPARAPALLVHRRAARTSRAGHGSLGGRAALRGSHPAAPRPHRPRGTAPRRGRNRALNFVTKPRSRMFVASSTSRLEPSSPRRTSTAMRSSRSWTARRTSRSATSSCGSSHQGTSSERSPSSTADAAPPPSWRGHLSGS